MQVADEVLVQLRLRKANPNPDVLRLLRDAGLGFECVSPGEIARLQEVLPDLPPERILFTPNFAPKSEYEAALSIGERFANSRPDDIYAWRLYAQCMENLGSLAMLNDDLAWTQQLGDAFLAQQEAVLDAVQRLRARADETDLHRPPVSG